MKYPFLRPNPPKLSEHVDALKKIESSGWFSNYGPTNTEFEKEIVNRLFQGKGYSTTVSNATIGLMLAIKHAVEIKRPSVGKKPVYAIMPSFTFAATAHAALWCGLTPLLCDIDPDTWLPSSESIEKLLKEHKGEVAVIVPYSTFGNGLDLAWYETLQHKTGIPVVVDAAASLGSYSKDGRHFGCESSIPIVFSMQATKSFSVAEAGLIYSDNKDDILNMRKMGNFGFSETREAILPGLNSKLPEVTALIALEKLNEFKDVTESRRKIARAYDSALDSSFQRQKLTGELPTYQFFPICLPDKYLEGDNRSQLIRDLALRDVEVRTYFSPVIHDQSYFAKRCEWKSLKMTERISKLSLSLPLHNFLKLEDVRFISQQLNECAATKSASKRRKNA
jgi:dTDP-4-amino-4,6-dideoxygalactose transaminase